MKVLFVCRSNVGRSQMAMEFYNRLYPGDAASAGTIVDMPGQRLKERGPAVEVVLAMKEVGIDMSNNIRTQLTPEMLHKYDEVVVLAEPESIPDYLKSASNVEIWNVEDARGKSVEETKVIRNEIKERVEEFADRLHSRVG